MNVRFDEAEFDKRQNALVGQIVREVHDILAAADSVPEASVNSLTGSLAFSICSLLDGCRQRLEGGGAGPLNPLMAFALDTSRQDVVMLNGKNSWMHEYVHGWVSELYDPAPHAPLQKPTAPCPHCGKPLRTAAACWDTRASSRRWSICMCGGRT
jgi:hypothetical protein